MFKGLSPNLILDSWVELELIGGGLILGLGRGWDGEVGGKENLIGEHIEFSSLRDRQNFMTNDQKHRQQSRVVFI